MDKYLKTVMMMFVTTVLMGQTTFEMIQKRGILKVITPVKINPDRLSRRGALADQELDNISDFAEKNGLSVEFVYVSKKSDLIPTLLAGKGDLIAAQLTATEQRKKEIDFTRPLTLVDEIIVGRTDQKIIKSIAQLKGRTVAIRQSSAFTETLKPILKKYPEIKVKFLPEHLDTEQILDLVANQKYDLTVVDSNLFASVKTYRDDLKKLYTLAKNRVIAWGVRKGDETLIQKLNHYISRYHVDLWDTRLYKDDLDGLKKRKVIRFLMRNNATSYFLYKGKVLGFEYELAKYFAKKHNLRLELVVPPKREDLIPWLLEGRGDIIASSITIPKNPIKDVAFSRYYNKVSELLITRISDQTLTKPEDLKGRTVVVRKSSSYWRTSQKLKASGIDFTLQAAPEDMETEEIIQKVASGVFDLTIADSHIVKIEMTLTDKIKSAFSIGEPVAHGWVIRKGNSKLKREINRFFKKEYKGLIYNMTYNKYFKNKRRIKRTAALRSDKTGNLSPYDHLVKKYAKMYHYNWVMLTSQMYQESRFDTNAVSWVGALGLMQVMPRTGKQMGFDDLTIPNNGIHAGVKYMDWLRKRFDEDIPAKDRTWFTLASYNAGFGHVMDARTLAEKLGLNPNKWFGNVEKAIVLLAKPKYYKRARYGYCRCTEPVKYVSEIKTRYENYQKTLKDAQK